MSKQEFLTLHFKRSKLFMLSGDKGTKRFITGPTRDGSVQVPAWVTETQTYQMGIKDGSIVNLTPPAPTIIYRDAPSKEEPEVSTGVEEDGSTAEDSVVEDPKDEDGADSEDESPTDETPKPRSRKKKKMSGPAGLIESTIKAQ